MKIVLAAVMHSPNLGDGLIAVCLTEQFRQQYGSIEIRWLDLAGRQTFATPSKRARSFLLSMLNRLPRSMSQILAARLLMWQIRKKLEPLIPGSFQDADAVVIGGGQLLADANLNFPLKIARVVREAEMRGIPIGVHSVGVAKSWSPHGRRLFSALLGSPNLRFVSVRDQESANNLHRHYRRIGIEAPEIHVFPDPALCANELEIPEAPTGVADTIGLSIAHPAAIKTHADQGALNFNQSLAQYLNIIRELRDCGEDITLFTNGAGEDEEMLDVVWAALPSKEGILRMPRPQTPQELVAAVRAMSVIASHRLHACITAHAVGTPAVGFRWDAKLDGYFALVNQSNRLTNFGTNANHVRDLILEGRNAGAVVKPVEFSQLAQKGVRDLEAALSCVGSSSEK